MYCIFKKNTVYVLLPGNMVCTFWEVTVCIDCLQFSSKTIPLYVILYIIFYTSRSLSGLFFLEKGLIFVLCVYMYVVASHWTFRSKYILSLYIITISTPVLFFRYILVDLNILIFVSVLTLQMCFQPKLIFSIQNMDV